MAGLSQGQVAKLLGISRPTVSEWEAGRRRVPSEELARLVETYGVSSQWILGTSPEAEREGPKVTLAARELARLKPDDLDRVIGLLKALRSGSR
jgi:transcriptional regulator with XRE-family HTH domain